MWWSHPRGYKCVGWEGRLALSTFQSLFWIIPALAQHLEVAIMRRAASYRISHRICLFNWRSLIWYLEIEVQKLYNISYILYLLAAMQLVGEEWISGMTSSVISREAILGLKLKSPLYTYIFLGKIKHWLGHNQLGTRNTQVWRTLQAVMRCESANCKNAN